MLAEQHQHSLRLANESRHGGQVSTLQAVSELAIVVSDQQLNGSVRPEVLDVCKQAIQLFACEATVQGNHQEGLVGTEQWDALQSPWALACRVVNYFHL